MDGEQTYDDEHRPIPPKECREGHPLGADDRLNNSDFGDYLCRTCLDQGVPDPHFRLRHRINPL